MYVYLFTLSRKHGPHNVPFWGQPMIATMLLKNHNYQQMLPTVRSLQQ